MFKRIPFTPTLKIASILALALVLGYHAPVFGAKGGSKDKKGVVLKFDGFTSRVSLQTTAAMRLGSTYRGSINQVVPNPQGGLNVQSIITYQRGNTTYIYPYRHRIVLPRFKTPEPQKY